jgi:hypothetical protein
MDDLLALAVKARGGIERAADGLSVTPAPARAREA